MAAKWMGSRSSVARLVLGAVLVATLAPGAARAKSVMVIGPHPDDETMLAGGRARAALVAGDRIKVVVVTNGDGTVTEGLAREAESVAAARVLGLSEQDVIFLGYGDQTTLTLYDATNGDAVVRSGAGQTATYGNRGLGGMDFHRYRTGSPGAYTRNTILSDFMALVTMFQPDEIYTVSYFDNHPDHRATALFVNAAILALKRQGVDVRTKVYSTFVWEPYDTGCNYVGDWPQVKNQGFTPWLPFFEPPCLARRTTLEWSRIVRFPVPPEMATTDPATNLKYLAISAYTSQATDWLTSFARKDEFFWLTDYGANLAFTAAVTTSSASSGSPGSAAVDGVIEDSDREWASEGGVGQWIQLDWPIPVTLAQVNLHDRWYVGDDVLAGTLSFSDGSSVAVGALPTDGKRLPVIFAPRTVRWVRFTITGGKGSNLGLAEIEALGVVPGSANVAPNLVAGPVPSPAAIDFTQKSTLSLVANDLDGDATDVTWSSDIGTVAGAGTTATFTPPAVGAETYAAIRADVADGRGGVTSSYAFVAVTVAAANSLSVSPASVAAGQTATGTVTLSSAAPSGGVSVPLACSDPSVATVPASVVVPSGATKATFSIATKGVSSPTSVTITATFGGSTRTASLLVTPPYPVSLSLSPTAVLGGATARATVTLSAAAGTGGAVLQVSSADPARVVVPATVTVPAGSPTATFDVATVTVIQSLAATVSVTDGTTTVSATLTVQPLSLSSITVSPTTLTGGASAVGTATLNGAAPPGGVSVALSSSAPTVAAVPATVTVPEGATSTTFAVTTSPVVTTTTVTIGGTDGVASRSTSVTVSAAALSSLAVSPTTVTGGAPATGTVTLLGVAPPAGVTVALQSSSAAAVVPASVTVPAGATSTTFAVATGNVSTSTKATLTATAGGTAKTATLTVNPLAVSALALSPASIAAGGVSTGTVTIAAAAPAAGLVVALKSSNVAVATTPATVTVAAGATTATFPVTAQLVAASTSATISVTAGGVTRSATLSVKVPTVSSVVLSPTTVTRGGVSTGTVTTSIAAPPAGTTVTLSSSNPAAIVPATVVVPAGATKATFSIGCTGVASNGSASISATTGSGTTRSATLTLTAAPVALSVALAPSTVTGGTPSTATVTLNGPAVEGGVVVTVRSNSAAAQVPASVVVPAGSTSARFAVTTSPVTSSTTATISTVAGGVTKRATLTVTP